MGNSLKENPLAVMDMGIVDNEEGVGNDASKEGKS